MNFPKYMDYSGWRVEVLTQGHYPDTAIVRLNGAEIEVQIKELNYVPGYPPPQGNLDSGRSPKA